MRGLKFRAWSNQLGSYVKWIFIKPDGNLVSKCVGYGVQEEDSNDYIIEQYTGLKDQNGKEIYEGDIVKIKATGRAYQIVYRKWDCSFVCENDEDEEIAGIFNDFTHQYEVIGNIHENKELMG